VTGKKMVPTLLRSVSKVSQLAMTCKPIPSKDGGCSRSWKNELWEFLCYHIRISTLTLAMIKMVIKYILNTFQTYQDWHDCWSWIHCLTWQLWQQNLYYQLANHNPLLAVPTIVSIVICCHLWPIWQGKKKEKIFCVNGLLQGSIYA
jgi:hypothetical protein